jgi:hypothetical protein
MNPDSDHPQAPLRPGNAGAQFFHLTRRGKDRMDTKFWSAGEEWERNFAQF